MGLKDFLKNQGFIEDDSKEKMATDEEDKQQTVTNVSPVVFPVQSDTLVTDFSSSSQSDPSFVAPIQQSRNKQNQLDPTFIKFFEDELVKANLTGPDYFEFRQLLNKTQQKMAAKGIASPEVILQTVLTSFEAQDITRSKLIETARQYKEIIKKKNEDFLKGAEDEKNNQLQKRQSVLQTHDSNIQKIQQQLQQLELQRQKLEDSLNKEKTQMEVDRTLGKEGIGKIEKAEQLISLAHNHIQETIDMDIQRLKSI